MNSDTKTVEKKIVTQNTDQLTEMSTLYNQMSEACEKHRSELAKLMSDAQTIGVVDDTIQTRLDDSVNLLLLTLDNLSRTPKAHPAGLGNTIVPPFSSPIPADILNANSTLMLKSTRIGLPSPLCLEFIYNPPTIHMRYNFNNIGAAASLSSYVLVNSGNINTLSSSAASAASTPVPPPPLSITVNDFVTKLTHEMVKVSAISGSFLFVSTRVTDQNQYIKTITCELKQ